MTGPTPRWQYRCDNDCRAFTLRRAILHATAGRIERVTVFGSRATGRHRPNPGLDPLRYGCIDAVADHLSWLDEAGSADVACLYRSFRFAVCGGCAGGERFL